MSRPLLRSARFRDEREARWRELEAMLEFVERRGVRRLDPADAARLPALYRAALASLSVARAISLDRNVIDYLHSLCTRAFFAVYGTHERFLAGIARFFARDFPSTVRALRWHVLAAAAVLAIGAWIGFGITARDPERYFSFVDESLAQGRTPLSTREELRDGLYAAPQDEGTPLGVFASFLFAHNTQVGFLCFTLGAALGVPAIVLMLLTGTMLGAMSQIHHAQGLAWDWWGWILPHGVTELLAVVLCAAGGLVLGQSVAFPGEWTRREQLARRGRAAGVLALGAMAMFLFAGLVEGFFRQLVRSLEMRFSLATATALFWPVYFTLAGRGARARA